jgi:hypothetical protein
MLGPELDGTVASGAAAAAVAATGVAAVGAEGGQTCKTKEGHRRISRERREG